MKKNRAIIFLTLLVIGHFSLTGQDIEYNKPGTGNPIVPGYFADPTVKKFGEYYYIYATTDGVRLASGEPQVWRSKDFVNWYDQEINLPFSLSNVWAPDVLVGNDGRYYYFHGNCEAGCNIYGYVSDSPMGPWESLNSENPLITPSLLNDLPALDQHYFLDEDGSLYVFYGTWIHNFTGLGWAKIDTSNMTTVLDKGFIPNAQLPDIFEAPYLLKRNGKYIMMYSSGDCQASTYRIQYAYSNNPTGPYTPGLNNPIIETSTNGKVDGPGHHSVLKKGDGYYIVYHRHDNPHSSGGEFRQLCADTLVFLNDTTLQKVVPTNSGIGYLDSNQISTPDLAFQATVSASSVYHLINGNDDYIYDPSYATDNNNGTMWRAGTNSLPQNLVIDLGSTVNVKRIMTQFEYATFYYQYKIEYSVDSSSWLTYADKTSNHESGSPKIDDGDVNARYLRITITGTEKTGMFAAIWNIKAYSDTFEIPECTHEISTDGPGAESTKSLLVEVDAKKFTPGELESTIPNTGTLGGNFSKKGNPSVDSVYKVQAIKFDGNDYLKLTEKAPLSLSWNSTFTISTWVMNPKVGGGECIVVWSSRDGNLMGEYAALMYGLSTAYGAAAHWGLLDMPYSTVPLADKWHHIALTFDGMLEKVYVDGILNNQEQKNLFIHPQCSIMVAFSGSSAEFFSGYMASLRMYDKCFPADSIQYLMNMDSLDIDYNWVPVSSATNARQNSFEIFYNNSHQKLTIKNKNSNQTIDNLKIIDLGGRTLLNMDKDIAEDEITIHVPQAGTFVVMIQSNDQVFSQLVLNP